MLQYVKKKQTTFQTQPEMFLTILLYSIAAIIIFAAALIIRGKINSARIFPHGGNIHIPKAQGFFENLLGKSVQIFREQSGAPQMAWARAAEEHYKTADVCVAYQRTPGSVAALPVSPTDMNYLLIGKGSSSLRKLPPDQFESIGFGRNILTEPDVLVHRQLRQHLQPAFSQPAVRQMTQSIFPSHVSKLVSKISEECAKQPSSEGGEANVCVTKHVDALTLDVIAQAAFHQHDINVVATNAVSAAGGGASSKQQLQEVVDVSAVFRDIFAALSFSFTSLLPGFIQRRVDKTRQAALAGSKKLRAAAATMADEISKKVDANRAETGAGADDDENLDGRKYRSLMEAMVSNKSMSREDLLSNSLVFLLAGADTTSSGLAWFSMLMAKHPDVQRELFDEIRDVIGLGAAPSGEASEIMDLPFLSACVCECMRVFPPVPVVLRQAIEEIHLPASGSTIPKGCLVSLSPIALHRSRAIWGEDADEFRPQRWFDGSCPAAHKVPNDGKVTYMPFLHGSRSCLGSSFAEHEFQVAAACLVRNFTFSWPTGMADPKRRQRATMRPSPDLNLSLKKRTE